MAKKKNYPKYFVSSLMSLGLGTSQAVKGRRAMKDVQKQVDAGGLQYNVMGEAEKAAEGLSADTEKAMQEQAALQQAQGMGALAASGDARAMMGAMPGMVQQGTQAAQNVAMAEEQARKQGEMLLMGEKQKAQAQDRAILEQEREAAQAMSAAGLQNIQGGIQGLEQTAMSAFGMPGMKHGAYMPATLAALGAPAQVPSISINVNASPDKKAEHGAEIEDVPENMVTPGEFNHDTNPIDIMHGDEKIGEATGGELIINKPDTAKLQKLIGSGNEDELMQFMQDLMVKISDNTMKNALIGAPVVLDQQQVEGTPEEQEEEEKDEKDEVCPEGYEKNEQGQCVPIEEDPPMEDKPQEPIIGVSSPEVLDAANVDKFGVPGGKIGPAPNPGPTGGAIGMGAQGMQIPPKIPAKMKGGGRINKKVPFRSPYIR